MKKTRNLLAFSLVLSMTIPLAWSQDQPMENMDKVGMLNTLLSAEVQDQINQFAIDQGLELRTRLTEVSNTAQGLTAITPVNGVEELSEEAFRSGADVAVLFFSPADPSVSKLKEGNYTVRISEDPDGTPRVTLIDSAGAAVLSDVGTVDSMEGKPAAGMTVSPVEAVARLDIHLRLHIHFHRHIFVPGRFYYWRWYWFWLHIHIQIQPLQPAEDFNR